MLLSSCRSVPKAIPVNDLHTGEGKVVNILPAKGASWRIAGTDKTIYRLELSSKKEAQEYLMERRLLLLRMFDVQSEPYFGTANAQECQDNLMDGKLLKKDQVLHVVIRLLARGKNLLIHDCLKKNNTHWLKVELLTCDSTFFDIRSPVLLSKPVPSMDFDFQCAGEKQ